MITARRSMDNSSPRLVESLRNVFYSLDRKNGGASNGFIKFQELADDFNFGADHRDVYAQLPVGFLQCVKKVTPFNGMLTFERVCAGLRLATAEERNRPANGTEPTANNGNYSNGSIYSNYANYNNINNGNGSGNHSNGISNYSNGGSNNYSNGGSIYSNGSNYAFHHAVPVTNPAVRSSQYHRNSVHNSLSTGSSRNSSPSAPPTVPARGQDSIERMRQLHNANFGSRNNNSNLITNSSSASLNNGNYANLQARPQSQSPNGIYQKNVAANLNGHGAKQPLVANGTRKNPIHPPPSYNQALSLSKLNLNHLEDVPENNLMNNNNQNRRTAFHTKSTSCLNEESSTYGKNLASEISPVGQKFISNRVEVARSRPVSVQPVVATTVADNGVKLRTKNSNNSIGQLIDNRRHTVTEGTDRNMLKYTRILHEEKDLIHKGQETSARLQTWYTDRLTNLETRQKLLGKSMMPLDFAVHEEKLNYLRAHVTELNRRIVALMESSEKGFPSYINVEVNRSIPQPTDDQIMWLKRQNKMLTDEVTDKTHRITLLEDEKASLIKTLFDEKNKTTAKEAVYSLPVKKFNHINDIHLKTNGAGEPVLATLM